MADYYPNAEGDQLTWCTTFHDHIATDGVTLGKTAGEITAMQGLCTAIKNRITDKNTARAAALAATAACTNGNAAEIATLRDDIAEIKELGTYTDPIGQNLGI